MSNFIDKSDYGISIRENILDQVIDFDQDKLDKAEEAAIELMRGYLNTRYDCDSDDAGIFTRTGTLRNPVILMHGVDISLYFLHKNINPRKIPEHRTKQYENAIEWLTNVRDCKINPPSLPKVIDGTRDYIIFGGNAPTNSHI